MVNESLAFLLTAVVDVEIEVGEVEVAGQYHGLRGLEVLEVGLEAWVGVRQAVGQALELHPAVRHVGVDDVAEGQLHGDDPGCVSWFDGRVT